MTYNFIKKQVKELCERYGTLDPLELCIALGIKVIYLDLPNVTKGFCLQQNGRCCIAINQTVTDDELPFCLAHELGHAMLHAGINYMFICSETKFVPDRFENEADCFALNLLMQETDININGKSAADLSRELKIPEEIVIKWIKMIAE